MTASKTKRTCPNGHHYYKSSACPVCPICEAAQKPNSGFQAKLSAPARRALENANIHTLVELANWTATDLLKLHGLGPSTIPTLADCLNEKGVCLKN